MSRHGSRFFTNPFFNSVEEGAREVNLAWLKREARAYISSITSRTPDEENYYGGAYTGIAGEGYGVLRASILFPENSENYLKFCEELVRTQIRHNKGISSRKDSQFILGMLGVYVMKSFCDKKRGTFDSKTLQHIIETTHKSLVSGYQREGDDEMLTGRAGILAAALNLKFISSDESIPEDLLKQVIDKILESGREYSLRNGSPCPLMYQWHGKEYLGAAHGLMGILQMLLSFPSHLDSLALKDIKATLDWLLSVQEDDGNMASNVSKVGKVNELVQWCHGAPGLVLLMIVAFLNFNDDRYLQSAKRALDFIWERGVLCKGPGICHGVAGNGYAFLLFYRLTQNEAYLQRARCFANIMCSSWFRSRARTPDRPYSLFEGIAGSLCFICDLADPTNAQFPLVPIPFGSF